MFEFIAFLIAVAAILIARSAHKKIDVLTQRVHELETTPGMAQAFAAKQRSVPDQIASPGLQAEPPKAPPPIEVPASAIEPKPVERNIVEASSAETGHAGAASVPQADSPPAKPKRSFEEQIGTRWVVWLGGLTLALGGLFLVRYSIEQGLLGPGARITLGAIFALALLGVGEWARRKDKFANLVKLPVADIPAILTAAGTCVAYGTVFSAYALYGFLAPASAFILLGIVALGTLAAALLHGPALAALGTVAAFVTPVLVSSAKPDFWALYIFLAVVTGAAYLLARARMWRWLVLTATGFGFLWMLPEIDNAAFLAPHAFHAIAGFALTAVLVVAGLWFGPQKQPERLDPISVISLSAWLAGATFLTLAHLESSSALMVFALLIGCSLAIAWRTEAATAIVPVAGGASALMFLNWTIQSGVVDLIVPGGAIPGIVPNAHDAAINLHLILGAAFALAFFIGGVLIQGRFIHAAIPVLWSATGAAVPIVILIALYARIAMLERSIPFALIALGVAAAFSFATERMIRRATSAGLPTSIALYATASLAALALAMTFAMEKGWLTVGLALIAPAAAWVSLKRPVPFLRWLAAILAAIVTLRLAYEPRIAGDAIGTTPIFNWLLYGYGVPALSFAAAGFFLRKRGDDAPVRMVDAAAILFTTLLVALEIRHAVHAGDIYRPDAALAEIGTQVAALLAMAIGLERIRLRTGSIVHNVGAIVLTALAGLATIFGLFIGANPLLRAIPIDGPFINLLMLGYALPAVLATILAVLVRGRRPAIYANMVAGAALILALAYVSLQVRRFYHGPVLSSGMTGDAEQYTYSLVWLGFGVALLAAGLLLRSQPARLASAAVIGLTILKAFVIDMGDLTGVYRALSFIGLGLVLVAIGWLYQRILFRKPADDAESAPS